MDAFMDSVGSIFRGGDVLPWCDRDIIAVSSFVLPAPRAPLSPRFSPGDHGSASAASLGRPGDECPPNRPFLPPLSCCFDAAANLGVECAPAVDESARVSLLLPLSRLFPTNSGAGSVQGRGIQ